MVGDCGGRGCRVVFVEMVGVVFVGVVGVVCSVSGDGGCRVYGDGGCRGVFVEVLDVV